MIKRTVMTETHVPKILAILFWENVSTPQRNVIAQLDILEHVTQLPDNVNSTQLVELTLNVLPDIVTQQEDAFHQLNKHTSLIKKK